MNPDFEMRMHSKIQAHAKTMYCQLCFSMFSDLKMCFRLFNIDRLILTKLLPVASFPSIEFQITNNHLDSLSFLFGKFASNDIYLISVLIHELFKVLHCWLLVTLESYVLLSKMIL